MGRLSLCVWNVERWEMMVGHKARGRGGEVGVDQASGRREVEVLCNRSPLWVYIADAPLQHVRIDVFPSLYMW